MEGVFKRPKGIHQKGDIYVEVSGETKRMFDGIKWRLLCSAQNCTKVAQRQRLCRKHLKREIRQTLSQNIKSPEVLPVDRSFKTEYDRNNSISSNQKDLQTNNLHIHSKLFF
jgi:hypothetical protein